MTAKNTICDFPRCGRPTHGFSSWCGMHAQRAYIHGSPHTKAGIRENDLQPYAEWVREGLKRYRNTKATQAALSLADALLNYQASHEFRYQLQLAHMMQLLRGDQVNAEDMLHRVCLSVAYIDAHPERFRGSTKAEDLAIGHLVMRLAPLERRGKKYAARAVALLGALARDALYTFALGLINRLKRDAQQHRELVKQTLDLDTPADVPVSTEPRAGVAYRKRRGVQ